MAMSHFFPPFLLSCNMYMTGFFRSLGHAVLNSLILLSMGSPPLLLLHLLLSDMRLSLRGPRAFFSHSFQSLFFPFSSSLYRLGYRGPLVIFISGELLGFEVSPILEHFSKVTQRPFFSWPLVNFLEVFRGAGLSFFTPRLLSFSSSFSLSSFKMSRLTHERLGLLA